MLLLSIHFEFICIHCRVTEPHIIYIQYIHPAKRTSQIPAPYCGGPRLKVLSRFVAVTHKGPVVPSYQSWPCRHQCCTTALGLYVDVLFLLLLLSNSFQMYPGGLILGNYRDQAINGYIVRLWLLVMACARWLISIFREMPHMYGL